MEAKKRIVKVMDTQENGSDRTRVYRPGSGTRRPFGGTSSVAIECYEAIGKWVITCSSDAFAGWVMVGMNHVSVTGYANYDFALVVGGNQYTSQPLLYQYYLAPGGGEFAITFARSPLYGVDAEMHRFWCAGPRCVVAHGHRPISLLDLGRSPKVSISGLA